MTEAAPMSGIVEGGKVENDENVPPFPAVNTEEKPFKLAATGSEKPFYNPLPRSRGRPPKHSVNSSPNCKGNRKDSLPLKSPRPRGRRPKNAVTLLPSSDGMKPDQSPLNLSSSPGLATENTTMPLNLSRSPGLAAENTTMPLPKPKNMKLDSLPLKSCTVKSDANPCTGPAEFKQSGNLNEPKASEEQYVLCTDDIVMTPVNPNSPVKASGTSDSKIRVSSTSCTPSTKKGSKRKRSLFLETLDSESKAARIHQFEQEITSLFQYFNEGFENNSSAGSDEIVDMGNNTTNVIVARLLEESRLPYSKLVQQIYEKLKNKIDQSGGTEISPAAVRSSVLLIGQRPFYGIPNADADVLEDESETCLWCWEVKDTKLLAKSQRDLISIRRRCRKKIHERITAISAMLSALSSLESEGSGNIDVAKAEELLAKADDEMSIRATVADLLQKNHAQIMVKQAKMKEKEAIKEKERNERKSEMEQKRLERELKREKIQQEREQVRAQKEAIIQEKEKKRQQEEAEKEQKRREKEEAEMKKQLAIQKQATLMDRFLNSKKDTPNTQTVPTVLDETTHNSLQQNAQICSGVMMSMDQILLQAAETETGDLLRSHLEAWHNINWRVSAQRHISWGIRRKPKVALFNELRLQGASAEAEAVALTKVQSSTNKKRTYVDIEDQEFMAKNLANDWEEVSSDSLLGNNGSTTAHRETRLHNKRRKLLQFDHSHRPAYYGTFSKKSDGIRPRNPFRKDSSLDYENDSDEEWEEEDPGESLSDCDKDDEEEKIEAETDKFKSEEDDDSDGFFVPDGYLSEDEGVCLDDIESDMEEDMQDDLPRYSVSQNGGNNQRLETESEWHAFERQQKVLENATEQALRSNHVFIITNLHNTKSEHSPPEPNARHRLEQICLQALRIQICLPEILIELPSEPRTEASPKEDRELSKRQKKNYTVFPDSDVPELIRTIQSSTQGMNKIVESLLNKFPSIPKKQLKSKIREISDFVENRWQVKKEVLEKLSIFPPVQVSEVTSTPTLNASEVTKTPTLKTLEVTETPTKKIKGITTYFSKRCLPPEAAGMNVQSSPDIDSSEKLKNMLPAMVDECKVDML
jgi:chromatin assembly factor 1 subunit A